jgi:tripartite-type tricarboxylate transporter receptor subunit TctC
MSTVTAVGRSVVALIAAATLCTQPMAQTWPDKPIRLIVNFPPGGVADTLARAIAPGVSEMLKQPVLVENKPGANGSIGADAVAKSPPDGYTFLVSSGGAMTVDPFLYPNLPYDTQKDLTPVASLAVVRVFLLVHPSVPAKNLSELLAYARANPGKLSYGSAGSGSSPHLAGEMLKRTASIEATHIPYKGAAPALNDLLGGQVQFMFDPGPGLQHVATGKLWRWASPAESAPPNIPRFQRSTSSAFASTPTRRSACTRREARVRRSSSG